MSLFIGMDKGLENESQLKFAARDAKMMAGIFSQSGMYNPSDLKLICNNSMESVQAQLKTIEASANLWKAKGDQTYLFLYFSGHGDAQSLHFNGKKMMREDLGLWLSRLPCDLKIVVLDACESGDFLRSKGGHYIQDLPVQFENNLKTHGSIIISSTSRGELAQESDEYQGAVFTHHFENGLRGLADYNNDGWISLQEAFEYSRRATSMDMALEGSLKQNPSFDLDLVGGSDPALIPIDRGKSSMLLRHFPSGNLDIYDANSLDRISRVWLSGSDSLAYRIPTGNYLFRFYEGGREFLHSDAVGKNGGVTIDRKKFQEKVRGSWVSKGGQGGKAGENDQGISAVSLNGLEVSVSSLHPYSNMPMTMLSADYIIRAAGSKQIFSFGYARGNSNDTTTKLYNKTDLYKFTAAKSYFIAGSRDLRFSMGGELGFAKVRQNLSDNRFAGEPIPTESNLIPVNIERWSSLYQVGVPFELEWALWRRVWIAGRVGYNVYGYEDGGSGMFQYRFTMEPGVKFGGYF